MSGVMGECHNCKALHARIAELEAELKSLRDKLHNAQGKMTAREYREKLTGGKLK